MTLQQEILEKLQKTGEWLDKNKLIKITADISESAGTFDDATGRWIPEIEGAYIDVLKPGADAGYKGRKGISKLRRLFNEVRFALPEGTYDLFADTPEKAALYDRWFSKDPLVKSSGNFAQKLNRKGIKVKYDTLQLNVPESLVQIGDFQDTKRVVFLRPTTKEGIIHARMLEEAYSAGGKSTQGLKPYWLQGTELFELEKGGIAKRGVNNPKGWRFKSIPTHRSSSAAYAMRKRGATPTFEELFETLKIQFPGVPDDELQSFTEIYQAMNKGQIDTMTAQRAISRVKLHGDHSIALSKGGLNWYNNLRNVPARVNLSKGASNTPLSFNQAYGISTNRAETIIGGLKSPIDPTMARRLGLPEIDTGVRYLRQNPPEFDTLLRQAPKAIETTGDLSKLARRAGSILPFVGAGLDAWDVQQRYQEMMNNPNEGFTDWLDKAQFGIASATLGTSFWAEPANAVLGLANLGIDATRTIVEEDKRRDFAKTMRGIGQFTTRALRSL